MVENSCRTKLPHTVIVKAPGLLPMRNTSREICEELGIAESTLRDWLQTGVPHQRDNRNRIWVNGERYANWVDGQRKPKKLNKLVVNMYPIMTGKHYPTMGGKNNPAIDS